MIYTQKNTVLAYTQKDCVFTVELGSWLTATSMSLTGAKILATVKTDKDSDTPLFTVETTDFIDPVLGNILVKIPRSNLNISAGLYAYEITYQDVDGDSSTVQVGDFILEQSIKTSI